MVIYIAIVILILIILTIYFLFLDGSWPRETDFSIDFGQVRALAASEKSKLPVSVNMITVATGELPSWAVAAGDFKGGGSKIEFPSFQLVYKNGTGIIEVPFDRRLFGKFPYGRSFYQENYDVMQKALLEADFIIPTHEHWDHLGGVSQSENLGKLLSKVVLTKEQVAGPTIKDAEFPESFFKSYKPIEYEQYRQAAPGVVLIKAPGHSRGHQFIFILLENGEELLFTGDVVWVDANFIKKRVRPRLANLKRKENRKQISGQMKYLHDEFYTGKNRKIKMIITHDPQQHEKYVKDGLLRKGFQLSSQ